MGAPPLVNEGVQRGAGGVSSLPAGMVGLPEDWLRSRETALAFPPYLPETRL